MSLSRRAFLKLGGVALSSAMLPRSRLSLLTHDPPRWLTDVPLGRVTESRIRLYSRPNLEGKEVGFKYRDDVIIVEREVVGKGFYPHNHVWFETFEGYAYSSWVQPVRYAPNEPLPAVSSEGIYVEVSVPFTDAHVLPDSQSRSLYRLYYGTTYQISRREVTDDGQVWYRLNDENVVNDHPLEAGWLVTEPTGPKAHSLRLAG